MNEHTVTMDFDPFSGNPIEKVIPATESQMEIWASCMIGGDEANLAYNESISLQLKGNVKEEIMSGCLDELVSRNESLRASFSSDGTQMIVYASAPFNFYQEDISDKPAPEQKEILFQFHKKDANEVFDIVNGPLIRFAFFKLSHNEYLLTLTKHHIISDGWSSGIILEELSGIYNARLQNTALPPKPLQFSDYAANCHDFSATDEHKKVQQYWVEEYKNDIPVFEITPDYPRPALRTYQASRQDFILDKDFANTIKATGAKYGCSFVTTLMAAFEVLLYKYSGQKDVVIGLPTAGQSAAELYNLVGHCVNILPLRSRPDEALPFATYLKQRKSKTLRDYEHQRFTFGSLLKKLHIHRDPSRIPLIPVAYNIDIGMNSKVAFTGITYDIIYNVRDFETFEIFLNIAETKAGFEFQWSYNTQLYKPSTIKALMDKYIYLLKQIIPDPAITIGALHLQDENSILKKVADWNNTFAPLPDASVIQLVENIAQQYPQKIAIECSGETYTYSQLNEKASQLAHYLLQHGVKANDVIAVVLGRGPQIVISLLAILKCGAAYLPVDPELPQERVNFMLNDAAAAFKITEHSFAKKFQSSAKKIVYDDVWKADQNLPKVFDAVKTDENNTIYLLYTSGSTGQPKGVKVTQKNLLNLLTGVQKILQTNEATRLLSLTTISFDIATLEVFLPLISAGTLVLSDSQSAKDPEKILHMLKSESINLMQATPATYKMMVDAGWVHRLPLRIISGGEALSHSLAQQLLQRVDVLYNMYAPTETTIYSTAAEIKSNDDVVTIGKPIQNTQVYILDDKLNIMPPGLEGEVYIGGAGVSNGYHNREPLTAEKFITNPFKNNGNEKLYKTGDVAKYADDGNIIYLGRNDDQVKIRGYRIELGEIETRIHQLPGVKDAVVLASTDDNNQKLIAYIVYNDWNNKPEISKEQLLEWRTKLKTQLPEYMIPTQWVPLQQLPLTPNKKVDKIALVQTNISTAQPRIVDSTYIDSTTDLVRNIWEEEIGITGINAEDDFFELGGHSMIAVKVMAAIDNATGIRLPISTLFEYPTISGLVKQIVSKKPVYTGRVVVPIKRAGSRTPIFLVHAGGLNILLYKSLSRHLDNDQPLYGLQGLGMDGDASHLQSIETIAARYLTELLEYDPNGPYIIMGYSYGGVIAYEMCRQLIKQGKKVLVLGILDTFVSRAWHTSSNLSRANQKIFRQFNKALYIAKNFIKYPKETISYQKLVFNRKFNKNYASNAEDRIYDYPKEIVAAYNDAYNNYKIEPLDVKIDLFRVKKRLYYIDDPVYLGWKKFALKGLRIHSIPGDHRTFMLPPNNKFLAEIIQLAVEAPNV